MHNLTEVMNDGMEAQSSGRRVRTRRTSRNRSTAVKTSLTNNDQMILEEVEKLENSRLIADENSIRQMHGPDNTLLTRTKDSFKSLKSKKEQKNELFDYLAYNGVKNLKAMEYKKIKEQKDLENCTFKP